jgi:hypothetical protein
MSTSVPDSTQSPRYRLADTIEIMADFTNSKTVRDSIQSNPRIRELMATLPPSAQDGCKGYLWGLNMRAPDLQGDLTARFLESYVKYMHHFNQLTAEVKRVAAIDPTLPSYDFGCFRQATREDRLKLANTVESVKTIYEMIFICSERLEILEFGTVDKMTKLLQNDVLEAVAAKNIYDADGIIQEHVHALWKNLGHDWERSFRFQLICVIVAEASKQAVNDLTDAFAAMHVDDQPPQHPLVDKFQAALQALALPKHIQDLMEMGDKLQDLKLQ